MPKAPLKQCKSSRVTNSMLLFQIWRGTMTIKRDTHSLRKFARSVPGLRLFCTVAPMDRIRQGQLFPLAHTDPRQKRRNWWNWSCQQLVDANIPNGLVRALCVICRCFEGLGIKRICRIDKRNSHSQESRSQLEKDKPGPTTFIVRLYAPPKPRKRGGPPVPSTPSSPASTATSHIRLSGDCTTTARQLQGRDI